MAPTYRLFHSLKLRSFSSPFSSSQLQHPFRSIGRTFSVKAIYSSTPTTLYYYSPKPKSTLFDYKEKEHQNLDNFQEAVTVADDGLVYPTVTPKCPSNGAILMPNTSMMQELVRGYLDEALDQQDGGRDVETPQLYMIPKGTPIPGNLILINDHVARFSLQPSRGMALEDLNDSLDEFFDRHAEKETAEKWVDAHPYHEAFDDHVDEEWMAQ